MRDFRDAKAMAQSLRHGLSGHGLNLTHSQTLELTAQAFGFDNWNILAARIEAARPAPADPNARPTLYCSFCGKPQQQVKALVAGPNVAICDACVTLCNDVIEHTVVLQLMQEDSDTGAGDHPALTAYLAGRSRQQIAAYLAGTTERLGALSNDEAAKRKFDVEGHLSLSEKALAAVAKILAERADE